MPNKETSSLKSTTMMHTAKEVLVRYDVRIAF